MNFYSIRTNDQKSIGQILNGKKQIVFDRLTWHKEEISIGDIIFVVISGDSAKKIHNYENGLRAIGKVVALPKDIVGEKHFNLKVEIFEYLPKTIVKEDFYIYPSLKDAPNIGPETKQAPNQSFRKIDVVVGKSIIRALFDILPSIFHKSSYDLIVDYDYNITKLELSSKNEEGVKRDFYNFLKSNGRIETTAKQYISKLTEVGKWFIENKISTSDFKVWVDTDQIGTIDKKLDKEFKTLWTSTNKAIKNWYSSPWNAWIAFNSGNKLDLFIEDDVIFNVDNFSNKILESNLHYSKTLINRFVSSLLTKPFVLLTGLSGSGKTKIVQSFVKWICEDDSQYKIIPVGADWTNREPLLGYPNGLNPNEYITPDSGALNLIIKASENTDKPYFLILDEMNLSHVERYFADFLSVMESDDKINLYTGVPRKDLEGNEIPNEIFWPKNLFIIGTVNIDETTYMFSPKVLDRANTIEFRVDEKDIKSFFDLPSKIDLSVLESKGASMAINFLEIAQDNTIEKEEEYTEIFVKFFNELKKVGAEFGYRTAVEMLLLIKKLNVISTISKNESIDIAVMQKLLPKLHGSRSKIAKVLDALILLCLKKGQTFAIAKSDEVLTENILYPIAYEKLVRMYKNALDNGFTSYAEA
jgi:5-methylcytosine-specific restriction protein B